MLRERRPVGLSAGLACATLAALVVVCACHGNSPVGPTPPASSCTVTLSPTSLTLGAAAGTATVTVSTGASCAWTAASDRGWMAVTSGASGAGPGAVSVALTANTDPNARIGTLTIGGQTVAVRQDGAPVACSIAVSPTSATFTKEAATGAFTVTTPPLCTWSATSGDGWITITADRSGTGTAVVTYAVARNTDIVPRTGTIRIDDAAFTVVQDGDTAACEFHVSPVLVNACMSVPYDLTVNVSTQAGCSWVATSDTPWITVGAVTGTGPGDISFRTGDNYDAPRLGVLKVRWDTPTAGQNVQVSQAGCRYAVSPSSLSVPVDGGTFTFDVYQQSDPIECGGALQDRCVWSAASAAAWVTITTSMPHSGDDRVRFTIAANAGTARSATITVRDQTIVVTQAGR